MAFLFFGHRTEKAASDCVAAGDQLVKDWERLTALLQAYNRMKDVILLDTVRITESLLDATGMSDLERTLWEAEYPKEDDSLIPGEDARVKAAEAARDKKAADALKDQYNAEANRLHEIGFVTTCFYHELAQIDSKMSIMNEELRDTIERRGTSFAEYSTEDISLFRRATALSTKLRDILSIRILDEEGKLRDEAAKKADELLLERK